jgi:hypothetical protein
MSNPFIIFAQARSGSTVLYRALQLHPQLHLALEPFHWKYHSWNPDEPDYLTLIKDIPSLDEQLAALFSKYNGIKILDFQLSYGLYTHLLLRPDLKIIALRRRNVLQQSVSGFIAAQTSVWQMRDMTDERKAIFEHLQPIDLNALDKEIAYRRECSQYYREVLARKPDGMYLSLVYEEFYTADVTRNRESLGKVFEFLELSLPDSPELDRLLDPRLEKINDASTYSLLPNAREIDARLGSDETGRLFDTKRSSQ